MVDEYTHSIIEQLTLRKLDYVRSLLKAVDFPYSGTRLVVRQRLVEAIESNIITVYDLHTLLDELDAWGDQRLRIGHLPTNILAEFQSASDVASHAAAAGLSHLLQGEIMLVPPPQLTPMKISYAEQTGQKRLHMVAAKTRQVMLPQPDIPDFVDQQYPGIVFKPFKVETQKALAFVEINLDTGLTFVSTTLLRQGQGYTAEFKEVSTVFQPFVPLQAMDIVPLYDANHRIRQLPSQEVLVVARQAKTSVGGRIHFRSHSARALR